MMTSSGSHALGSNAMPGSYYYLSGDELATNPEWFYDEETGTALYLGDSVFEDGEDPDEFDDGDDDDDDGDFFAGRSHSRKKKKKKKKTKKMIKEKKIKEKKVKRAATDGEKKKSAKGTTKKARTHYFENQLGMLVKKKQR